MKKRGRDEEEDEEEDTITRWMYCTYVINHLKIYR